MTTNRAGLVVLPALALGLNALVWGLSWWPFRQLQNLGLHPLWSTALIYLLAAAYVLAVHPRALLMWLRSPWLWLLALASGFTNVGFNWAVTVGDVVRVVLLFYLMPAWAVLLAWPLLGEKPGPAALARVGLALAGVFVVLTPADAGLPLPRSVADWLALAGGLSFALTNILLRRLNQTPAAARAAAMFGGCAVLGSGLALVGVAQNLIPALPAPNVAWLLSTLALGGAFLLANLALQYGAARLKAQTTALIMVSEVVFASLSAVALGAAQLNLPTVLGAVMIVSAALWAARA